MQPTTETSMMFQLNKKFYIFCQTMIYKTYNCSIDFGRVREIYFSQRAVQSYI